MKPLAITGLGVVSPLGVGRASFEAALADTDGAGVELKDHRSGSALKGGGDGLHLGEGAAYLCVERDVPSEVPVLGRIAGYGTAFEPPESEVLLVHVSADAVARAVEGALEDADIAAGDVDAVCSSVGGLAAIDGSELEGIRRVLGDDVAIAAPKQIYGETFGGGGALGMATALAWMHGAPVAPIIGGKPPREVRTVIVDAVGFYGNTSAVVLQRPGARAATGLASTK